MLDVAYTFAEMPIKCVSGNRDFTDLTVLLIFYEAFVQVIRKLIKLDV